MVYFRYSLGLISLAFAAGEDGKKKAIPFILPLACGLAALILCICDRGEWIAFIAALFPGLVLLAVSFLTGEKVGYGDGLMTLVAGAFTDFEHCVVSLMLGLCLSGVYSLIVLALRRVKGTDSIPFLPFLLAGYISALVILE